MLVNNYLEDVYSNEKAGELESQKNMMKSAIIKLNKYCCFQMFLSSRKMTNWLAIVRVREGRRKRMRRDRISLDGTPAHFNTSFFRKSIESRKFPTDRPAGDLELGIS